MKRYKKSLNDNLEDLVNDFQLPPSVVLDRLNTHLYHTHARLNELLPALHDMSVPSALGLLEASGGLAQMGDWAPPSKKFTDKAQCWPLNTRLLIHWPTLIRNADELAFNNPVMAVFFLSFRNIIHQRSPFVLEALKRRYKFDAQRLKSLHTPPTVSEEPETLIVQSSLASIPSVEMRVLKEHLTSLSKDQDFIKVLRYACSQAYCGISGTTERRSFSADRRGLDPVIYSRCSRIYFADSSRCSAVVEIVRPRTLLDSSRYCCADLNWLLEELWVAYHLAHPAMTPNMKAYGSEVVIGVGLAVRYDHLFIRWESWLNYRQSVLMRGEYLSEVVKGLSPRSKRILKELTYENKVLRNMDKVIRRRYTNLATDIALVAEPAFEDKLTELWGSVTPEAVSVISLERLKYLSIYRQSRSQTDKDPEAAVRASAPPLNYSLTLSYPDGSPQDLQIHHTGRKLLVIPFWDMSRSKRFHNNRRTDLYATDNLRPGVFSIRSEYCIGYSCSFLLDPLKSPQTPHEVNFPHLVSTLKMLKVLSRKELKRLIDPPDPYSSAKKWSPSEDTLIKVLYRPNMSAEDQRRLTEGCPGRRPNAISTRAKYLCEQLISKGVYDIKDLPHKNRNPNLLAKIRKAKKGGSPK